MLFDITDRTTLRWKIPAASAASAWASWNTSEKCLTCPALQETMTGIPTTTRSMYVKNPVKKYVKNVSFSHTFHMFFTAFHMYFTHIFHVCVKFSIVKYMWKLCEKGVKQCNPFHTHFHIYFTWGFTYKFTSIAVEVHFQFHMPFHVYFTWDMWKECETIQSLSYTFSHVLHVRFHI